MSKIEWTEKTWNPVTGCTKISEGCQNCYAEKMTKRLQAMGQEKYQHGFDKIQIYTAAFEDNFGKKPKMIFVNSMSDTFTEKLKDYYISTILDHCSHFPQHKFQVLTKRSERLKDFNTFYSKNIWLGVTVELEKYKNRIDDLRQTRAKVKFLSCEPLLGDLGELDLSGINWVIVGGESGHNARPVHPDWIRNIQKQCQEQNVPFFFKQWGEYSSAFERNKEPENASEDKYYYGKYRRLNFAGGQGFHGENLCYMQKVGKKKSGSFLDGKEYKEYPKL